ncbi:MAG: DUF1800 family protein [Glaciecola sp.]|nr:DUF1800 family protein [Glaciecola sp.]
MTKYASLIIFISLLSACGGGSETGVTQTPSTSPVITNTQPSANSNSNSNSNSTTSISLITSEPTSLVDAARFLTQATFGPTMAEIEAVAQSGLPAWIDAQMQVQQSAHRAKTLAIYNADINAQEQGAEWPWNGHRYGAWMDIALHGEDQLRQRVAFALSQLFVVSDKSQLDSVHLGIATYYDGLAEHAFGNYRDLLEFVTLSPVMGVYLNMLGNEKPNAANNIRPDENFAREVMQLFTIGLDELNLDGTLKSNNGEPIPTYDIDTVKAYAHVFTGWNFYGTTAANWYDWWGNRNFRNQMILVPQYHAIEERKMLLNDVVVEPGTDGETAMQLAINSLFQHQNVAPFVSKHLIQRLVTSNPTPAYIRRVATVFENNGNDERGDLGAVVKALLLDPEARNTYAQQHIDFGKVKEPLIRGMQYMRAFGVYMPDIMQPQWTDYQHNQAPLASPSVFNFYSPDFSPVGALNDAGLVAPEMQIINDTYMVRNSNHAAWMSIWAPSIDEVDNGHDRRLTLNYEQYETVLDQDVDAFIDWLDIVLMSGSMNATMRQTLRDYDTQLQQWTQPKERVRELTFMVTGSPQFAVQR